MSAKRKQYKGDKQKTPNSNGGAEDGTPSSARRSRRLRGAEAEFNANALEEIEMERRSSRSRSRSATPAFDRPSKLEASAGPTKTSTVAFPSKSPPVDPMATNLSANRSENSPQRARIDFDDSGANDSFGSGGRSVGGRKKRTSAQNIVEKKRQSRAEEPKQITAETDQNDGPNVEEKKNGENDEKEEKRGETRDKKEEEDEEGSGKSSDREEEEQEEGGGEDELFSEDERIDEVGEDQDAAEGGTKATFKGTGNDNGTLMRDQSDDDEEEEGEIVEEVLEDANECNGKMAKRRVDEEHDDEEIVGESDEQEEDEMEDNVDEKEEEGEESGYEEDIEDPKVVQQKRGKLPKSAVDDKFFNLAEMNAFLDAEDRKEEDKMRQRNVRNLGQIENADELEQLISAHEQSNLQPREWALSGEAKAEERPKDALLEQYVDADYRMAAPPTIDAEKTAQLEGIITKRIKDGLFDDVVRKVRVNESLQPAAPYRNATVNGTTEQKVRKSLAEVYGDKLTAGLNDEDELGGEGKKEDEQSKLDPAVEEIKSDLDTLFLKLDALSHFQFRPQPIQEEVKIVNNMPSLHMEEVGPQAAVGPEVNLLAPEEVKRRVKSAPKGTDERTETDRKRQRRQKKKKQRILASIGAMNGEGTDGAETAERVKTKKKVRRVKMNFAEQINKLVQNEGEQQLKKKKKRKIVEENGEEKKSKKMKKKSKVGGEKE
ncbi:hypothetical protein niasHS_007629 [Heterodera schachtii]|uniref:Uncharacterized protein n=1 Tax=Heterodera schachtii TaxID=97005 RepID=A0ABD2JP72_HETSC